MPLHTKPSLLSRLLEWLLWRLPAKKRFADVRGLRERVLSERPRDPRPPRSLYRRFRVEESMHDGQRVFTLSPRERAVQLHVIYLHGGAYVAEMMPVQWKMMARLLERLDASITVPLYPLAPEHTCLEVLAFARSVYSTVLDGAGNLPAVLLGDSAGGGMALAISQSLREADRQQPAALVLLSPWLDVTCADPRQEALNKVDPLLAPPGLQEEGIWYAGALSPTDPKVSPIFGDLRELPPMLVLTGTHDLLNADAHRLREAMAGAPPSQLRFSEYEGMLHVWPAMPIPEAGKALDEVAAYLKIVAAEWKVTEQR